MTPTASALLEKAHRSLSNARAIAAIAIPEVAAREAYLAAFHAAQALIFEWTGAIPKTHSGVRQSFGHLVVQHGLDETLGRFLAQAYDYKTIADYDTARRIAPEDVPPVLDATEALIVVVEQAIARGRAGGQASET